MSATGGPLVLADAAAVVEIHPAAGGAVGRYDVRVGMGTVAVFQTATDPGRKGPSALGCNVLVPFSNRISGGGFRHGGRFHALAPVHPEQRYPIHGNGLEAEWTVRESSRSAAVLSLVSDGPGPFRYAATLSYGLEAGALAMRLAVRNTGPESLPFGVGFHPWFVRTPQTRLQFRAAGRWTETADHLPRDFVATAAGGPYDFSAGAPLPGDWINSAFTGWDGVAWIAWPEHGAGVAISAAAPMRTAILYAPSAAADYFCLEPVSHSVDAHNRSEPGTQPPQVLAPGETLVAETIITPYALEADAG